MLRALWALVRKDMSITLLRGSGLVQALLLGLLLLFVFSLSLEVGAVMPPQGAAAVFWLSSVFCQVLIFNMLYGLEEVNSVRQGLLLVPHRIHIVWVSKGLAGLFLLLLAQAIFLPAAIVFLGQSVSIFWGYALVAVLLVDIGMVALGSLLGALAQGQATRESLLSMVLFPLLVPLLLAGIRIGAGAFDATLAEGMEAWFGIACAFDALFLGVGLLLFGFMYAEEE